MPKIGKRQERYGRKRAGTVHYDRIHDADEYRA